MTQETDRDGVRTKGFRTVCGDCGKGLAITVAVEGKRLCAPCRDKWLIEETDSFALASRLTDDERDALKVFTNTPSRLGFRERLPVVVNCEFALFGKVWGGDCHRYFLTPFGLEVKAAVLTLEARRPNGGTQ